MKKRNLLSGLWLALFMTLGIAGTAYANNYDCNDQANHPIPTVLNNGDFNISGSNCVILHDLIANNGDINITVSGTLSVQGMQASLFIVATSGGTFTADGDITASDFIGIGTTAGDLKVKQVISQSSTTITAPGKIETTNVEANNGHPLVIASTGGDVIVTGTLNNHYDRTDVSSGTGSVTVSGTSTNVNAGQIFQAAKNVTIGAIDNENGDVRVFAHQDGVGSTPLAIGSGGVGSITNDGLYGFGIYISSPTGISYSGANKLSVNADSGPTGTIILDGGATGTVTLTGSLTVDDINGSQSGSVVILAPTIVTNGMTINANAVSHTVGDVQLVTDQLTTSGNLTVNMNGNGDAGYVNFAVYPVGTHGIAYPPTNIYASVEFTDYSPSTNPLTISGIGNFTINADGNDSSLEVLGYPLAVNGPLTVNQKGSGDSFVLSSTDGGGNFTNITLGRSIAIHENSNAPGQNANSIRIDAVSVGFLASQNILLDAAGTNGGDGGNIFVTPSDGEIKLGTGMGKYTLNANSSDSGGNAGSILVGFGGTLKIIMEPGDLVTASAIGDNGDGGSINITGGTLTIQGSIIADAIGSGDASTVNIEQQGTDDIMVLFDATISASADPDGYGNGGQITITGTSTTDLSQTLVRAVGSSGGLGGLGGSVVVNAAQVIGGNPLNVNAHVFVDGDSTLGTTDFDGSISMNGVTCQQWKTGKNWPESYWDCVNPTSPGVTPQSANVVAAAASLLPNLTTASGRLKDNNHQIYILPDPTAMNGFFGTSFSPPEAVGQTFPPAHISAVFVQDGFGNANLYMDGTMIHELGHALDYIWGNPYSTIASGDWLNAYNDDTVSPALPGSGTINSVPCSTVWPSPSRVCADHAGNYPNTTRPWTNWEIFQDVYPQTIASEMIAVLFEHGESVANSGAYHVDSGLEHALEYFPNMMFYISHAISTGTP